MYKILYTNSILDSDIYRTAPNCGDPSEVHSQPFKSFSYQPSLKGFNSIAFNKRNTDKVFFGVSNTTGDDTLTTSNTKTLSNIAKLYLSLLQDTISRISKEINNRRKILELSKDKNSNPRLDLYTY